MIVYLVGDFAKKKNSTKRPVLTAASVKSFDMQLKEETSVLRPVLLLNPSTTGMPSPFTPTYFNYAFIPTFQKYYFVTDWQFVNGLWYCYMSVDVLATYKTGISALSEYVVRSSSTYNGDIIDNLYPAKSGVTFNKESFSMALSQTGVYVVGIINNSANAVDGAITYYMMTNAEIGQLKTYLMSETFLANNGLSSLTEMSKDLVKAVFNPFQYIVSCRFFPIDYNTATSDATSVSSIEIGWWQINTVTAKRMPSGKYIDYDSNTFTAGSHPQAAARGNFLNHSPFVERVLIHPLVGTVLLDSNKINGGDTIKISTRLDFTTGDAELYVEDASRQITLYRTSIRLAIDVQLAQIATDYTAIGQTAVNSISGVVSSALTGNIGGVLSTAATGIIDALAASQPVMQTSGTNGNRSVYHISGLLFSFYHSLVDDDLSHRGRPLCRQKTISTLSGFIMCADAHAELACYDSERQEIVNYMNTGFYYE